jgi:hypothetical protein
VHKGAFVKRKDIVKVGFEGSRLGVLRALGGTVLALTLSFTANGQANAAAPYLIPLVPLSPGETPPTLNGQPPSTLITDAGIAPEDQGLYMEYFLREDEAIVLVGKTPPKVKYFGFTNYLTRRYIPKNKGYSYIFGSLGDTTNNYTIATANSKRPYNQPMVFISTADSDIDRRIRAAAAAAGYPSDIINTSVFPAPLVNFGLPTPDSFPDTFLLLQRAALFASQDEKDKYYNDPGVTVFRITPRQPAFPRPFLVPDLRVKGTGDTNELNLLPTEHELGEAIRKKYSYLAPRSLEPSVAFVAGYEAVQDDTNAYGDNRDTIYLRSDNFFLEDNPDDFVVVYGVNHVKTGKAVYSNFSVYGKRALNGVGSVDNSSFPTAEQFLPGNRFAKYFYVYKIARQCTPNEEIPCLPISTKPPAEGIEVDQLAFLAFRAYVEPSTKVGPEFEEVLYDQAIKFSPR